MGNESVAIVLGGTNPHIELIKKLKNRGFYTVLVDYLDNPPARVYADVHEQVSTLDLDAVVEVAKKYSAKLVISACVDQANVAACYAAEQLGLTKPYSYELANNITNKGYMKKIMIENDIPTSKHIYLDKGMEIENFDLSFPVIVKPADCCAASGVKKALDKEEMIRYLADAQKISRNGRAVIEEFKAGIEVSIYAFVKNYKTHILMITQRFSVIEGEKKVLKCYATYAPAQISDTARAKLQDASDKIAAAFKLNNTPLHVQAIIDGDEVNIIEFAPRVGGGISYKTIQIMTGFDILEAAIDSYLQIEVNQDFKVTDQIITVNLVYAIPGVFDHMTGVDELIKNNVIEGIYYHKTKGMQVSDDRASGGRIAAFIVKAASREELLKKIETAIENMQVFDVNGKEIMRKDLYLK